MTFWDFIEKHGTKMLGLIFSIVGSAALNPEYVPPKVLPFVMILAGALTVWRGVENQSNIAERNIPLPQPPEKT